MPIRIPLHALVGHHLLSESLVTPTVYTGRQSMPIRIPMHVLVVHPFPSESPIVYSGEVLLVIRILCSYEFKSTYITKCTIRIPLG